MNQGQKLTFAELLAEGQRKVAEQRAAAEEARVAAERAAAAAHREAITLLEMGLAQLIPPALWPYMTYEDIGSSLPFDVTVYINAPGCAQITCAYRTRDGQLNGNRPFEVRKILPGYVGYSAYDDSPPRYRFDREAYCYADIAEALAVAQELHSELEAATRQYEEQVRERDAGLLAAAAAQPEPAVEEPAGEMVAPAPTLGAQLEALLRGIVQEELAR